MTIQEREAIKQEVRKEIMEEMNVAKQRKAEYAAFTKGLDKHIEQVYPAKCKERMALKSAVSSVIKTCLKLDRLSNIPAAEMNTATELAGKVISLVLENKRVDKDVKKPATKKQSV